MIVRRESTIIDYHGPFDQALRSLHTSRLQRSRWRIRKCSLHRKNIAKLYVRLFKRKKQDFTPGDFELRKKALPMMKRAFEEGDKVRFTKSKLLIDGMAVPVQ